MKLIPPRQQDYVYVRARQNSKLRLLDFDDFVTETGHGIGTSRVVRATNPINNGMGRFLHALRLGTAAGHRDAGRSRLEGDAFAEAARTRRVGHVQDPAVADQPGERADRERAQVPRQPTARPPSLPPNVQFDAPRAASSPTSIPARRS